MSTRENINSYITLKAYKNNDWMNLKRDLIDNIIKDKKINLKWLALNYNDKIKKNKR